MRLSMNVTTSGWAVICPESARTGSSALRKLAPHGLRLPEADFWARLALRGSTSGWPVTVQGGLLLMVQWN
jgi:hypothetical protein